ncbi:GRIP1-associated protein 1-like [Saccostrea cucullata]|uniref:GRIP1-associated protein 1-like n=1 Tax=Saccostrea cuccullata TaxID=36930 RepID=UPI002ED5B6EB
MDEVDASYQGNLQSVWDILKTQVRLSDIADHMVERGTLTLDQWEELNSGHLSEEDKTEEFLYILLRQNSPKHFRAFIEALINNGQSDLASKLQSQDIGVSGLNFTWNCIDKQTMTDELCNRGAASDCIESNTAMRHSVDIMERLMEKLEIMYERQEQKIDSIISEQKTAQKQMGIVLESNETVKVQMENIAEKIENKFEILKSNLKEKQTDYELLNERYRMLLEGHEKKEEELRDLKTKVQNIESNPEMQSNEMMQNLQTQFIALKKTNEERVSRLKSLHTETKKFLKVYAETFQIPQPEHLSEIEEHFGSIKDSMHSLKSDKESLKLKITLLVKENENLIAKSRRLEENIVDIEKEKSKIEVQMKKTKGARSHRTTSNLKGRGKKCH